ncbi:carbohydrate ABC transporter substrate-binding protein [Cohnella endophytica]|uniref:Carbohydrate ABC transporter substrate-binding protein n=1 Tax=Cohnella endophytica TaxID=2419778 RepID=A0A494XH03_9BACL|nr:ABC transporter substrate-binding protein [Cohnella endophytica]RKP49940.1 carbohydrate ABC transporter substrate-binding protein [Cohnella endophytica]
MNRKLLKIVTFVTMICLILALAACGSNKGNNGGNAQPSNSSESAETPAPSASQEPMKLTIIGHGSNFTTGWEAVLADAKTKGFEIQVEKLPEGSQGDDIVKTRLATKELPDILLNYSGQANIMGNGNPDELYVDLSNQAWVQNLNLDTWGSSFAYQGKVVGAPFQGSQVMAMFYNKKVFESAGVNVPTTYEEFLATCDAIAKAGKTPVFLPGKDPWTLQFSTLFSTAQKDSTEIAGKLNQNQMKFAEYQDFKAGLDVLKEIVDKGYGSKDPFAHGYDDAEKALANGDAAMFMMGAWFMTDIVKKYPDKVNDIGAFAMPIPGGKTPTVAVSPSVALYAMKGTKNQTSAEKFIEYFESIDTQNIFFGAEGGIPEITGVSKLTLTPAEMEAKAIVDAGNGFVNYQGSGLNYAGGDFPSLSADIVGGKKTPQQVLEAMDKEFVKQAKIKNDPNFK